MGDNPMILEIDPKTRDLFSPTDQNVAILWSCRVDFLLPFETLEAPEAVIESFAGSSLLGGGGILGLGKLKEPDPNSMRRTDKNQTQAQDHVSRRENHDFVGSLAPWSEHVRARSGCLGEFKFSSMIVTIPKLYIQSIKFGSPFKFLLFEKPLKTDIVS
ncbi:hypothetical protein Tco_1440272 [Tanacetum coccineum]